MTEPGAVPDNGHRGGAPGGATADVDPPARTPKAAIPGNGRIAGGAYKRSLAKSVKGAS